MTPWKKHLYKPSGEEKSNGLTEWLLLQRSKRTHTSRLDQFSKGWAELRISVMQQTAAAF